MTDEMNRLVDKAASALEAAGAKEVHVFGSGSMNPPNNDLIGDIVRRIVETAQPEKIILFGSRARGDARPNSDFDVLVIKESSEPSYRRDAPLYLALAGLNAPVDVMVYTPEEVTDWSAVPQAFITTALREGKVVYERKG
jgi:predicted nucleotidyltransferase